MVIRQDIKSVIFSGVVGTMFLHKNHLPRQSRIKNLLNLKMNILVKVIIAL